MLVTEKPKRSITDFLILGSVVVAIIIWGVVIYLFFQNKNIKKDVDNTIATTQKDAITPIPTIKIYNFEIKNGNVVNITGDSEEVIIDKSQHKSSGITGFISVKASPDNSKICFESWPPSPQPAIYIANADGSEIVEVGNNKKGCMWSSDNNLVTYTNLSSEEEKEVNIFSYDVSQNLETNLTSEFNATSLDTPLVFKIISLNESGDTINCQYYPLDNEEQVTDCEINIASKTVNEKAIDQP